MRRPALTLLLFAVCCVLPRAAAAAPWSFIVKPTEQIGVPGYPAGTEVTPELLLEKRIIRELKDGLKVLGDGTLDRALTVRAHKFSKSAVEKITASGGSAEVIGK